MTTAAGADIQCVGVCMIDADTGVCIGCGRAPEEISGVQPTPAAAPAKAPLPADVAAEAQNPSD